MSLRTYTDYTYDGRNHLVRQVQPQVTEVSATNLATQIRPTDVFGYDAQGRQVVHEDPNGVRYGQAHPSYGAYQTVRTYDAAGQLISESQPDGGGHVYRYDIFGNQVTALKIIATGLNDGEGGPSYNGYAGITSTYDLLNRLVSTTDSVGQVTRYTYDLDGRKTHVRRLLSTATDGTAYYSQDTYLYDTQGRLVDQRLGEGVSTSGGYSGYGGYGGYGGGSSGDPYVYVPLNPADPGIHKAFEYDLQDHKTAEINDTTHLDVDGTTLVKDRQTWVYDVYGRVQSGTDLSGDFLRYTYDAAGELRSLDHYDGDVLTAQSGASSGNAKAAVLGLKQQTSYQYAGNGWLVMQNDNTRVAAGTTAGSGGLSDSSFLQRQTQYDYDARGQRVEVIELDSQSGILAVQRDQTYTYDALGREVQQTDALGTTSFDGSTLAGWTQKIYNGQANYDNGHWEVRGTTGDPAPAFYGYAVRSDADLLYRHFGIADVPKVNLQFDTAITLDQTNSAAQYYFLSNERSGPSIYVDFNGGIVYLSSREVSADPTFAGFSFRR